MKFRDDLRKVDISTQGAAGEETSTSKKRKERQSISQVKKDIAALVKTLIAMCQVLPELPRRRFITLKLYYTDETPDDYQRKASVA